MILPRSAVFVVVVWAGQRHCGGRTLSLPTITLILNGAALSDRGGIGTTADYFAAPEPGDVSSYGKLFFDGSGVQASNETTMST